jgi:hypothetical protein
MCQAMHRRELQLDTGRAEVDYDGRARLEEAEAAR